MSNSTLEPSTETIAHAGLRTWVEEIADLTKPAAIHVCDGSADLDVLGRIGAILRF